MMNSNALLNEITKIVQLLGPVAPSTSVPDFVSLKGYNKCALLIAVKNGSTVTGSAITLTQAKDVSNTSGKALGFSTAYRSINTGPSGNNDTLSSFAVASNTFTTDATNSTDNLYVIEINETDLDVTNGFDCVRPNTGNTTNATLSVVAVLWPAKFAGQPPLTAIAD